MFKTLLEDKPYIEGKYHKVGEPYDSYARFDYVGWEPKNGTGLNDDEMQEGLKKLFREQNNLHHAVSKANGFKFVCENSIIDISEHDYFVYFHAWRRPLRKTHFQKWGWGYIFPVEDSPRTKGGNKMPAKENTASTTVPQTSIASISVRCEGRNELVEVMNIESLEALKDYTRLTLTDGRQLSTLGTLTSMEQQLPSETFIRVQRSYVVNLKRVQSYNMQSLRLVSGMEIPIGKTYREEVHSSLSQLYPSV